LGKNFFLEHPYTKVLSNFQVSSYYILSYTLSELVSQDMFTHVYKLLYCVALEKISTALLHLLLLLTIRSKIILFIYSAYIDVDLDLFNCCSSNNTLDIFNI